MTEAELKALQPKGFGIAQKKRASLGGHQVYQPSNFHIQSLSRNQMRESLQPSFDTLKSHGTDHPWAFFQLKPGLSNFSEKSKKFSVTQGNPESQDNSNSFANELNGKSDLEDSLENIFAEVASPDASGINIPKCFVSKKNNIASLNALGIDLNNQVTHKFNSLGELRVPQSFNKIRSGSRNLSGEEISKQEYGTSAERDLSYPHSAVLNLNSQKSGSDKKERRKSSEATGRRSGFWREPLSLFLFKKTATGNEYPESSTEKGETSKTPIKVEDSEGYTRADPQNTTIFRIKSKIELFLTKYPKIQKFMQRSKLLWYGLLILIIVFIYSLIISIFAFLLTFGSKQKASFLWVDEFFNGLLLGGSLIAFLRSMTKINFQDNIIEQAPEYKSVVIGLVGNYKYLFPSIKLNFMNIMTGIIILISSLIMVLSANLILDSVSNPYFFLGKGVIVLLINILIVTTCMKIRNNYLKKQAIKEKGRGFFGIPVYKNFIQDLSSARITLETFKITQSGFENQVPIKESLAEDHFQKQKKQEYEVITLPKIISSQLLLILLYLQLIATTGFAYSHKGLEEESNAVVVLIILVHPFIAYIFKLACDFLNKKTSISMDVEVNYVNYMLVTIFSRITFMFTRQVRFICITILMKLSYKIIIYHLQQKQVESLHKKKPDFISTVLREDTANNEKKENEDQNDKKIETSKINIIKRQFTRRRPRLNTIMQAKLEKLDAEQRQKKEVLSKNFIFTLVLLELTDLTMSLGSMCLLFFCQYSDNADFLGSLDEDRRQTYVSSTLPDIFCNCIVTGALIWFWNIKGKLKYYEDIPVVRPFFKKYLVHFLTISMMLFFTFFNIMQIFDGKSCCN